MEKISAEILLYHNLSLVCTGLFVLCALLAAVMFFRWRIADTLRLFMGIRKNEKNIPKRQPAFLMERELVFVHTNETID